MLTMSCEPEPLPRELADREERARERERRDDRVHARAVRQARVDHRRRLVDAPADLRDHPIDDPPEVRVVREADRRLVEAALTLDPDLARPVDHDLRDRVVGEQALERPVAEDVVGDLVREPFPVVPGDARLAREMAADVCDDAIPRPTKSIAWPVSCGPSSLITCMWIAFLRSANGSLVGGATFGFVVTRRS